MSNIKVVELLNGEKLVAEVVFVGNETLVGKITFPTGDVLQLTNTLAIIPQNQDQSGNVTFQFIPWPMFKNQTDKTFEINRDVVVTTYEPNVQILDNYNRITQQMNSSLILPPQGIRPAKLIVE